MIQHGPVNRPANGRWSAVRQLVEVAPGVHVAQSRRDRTTSTVVEAAGPGRCCSSTRRGTRTSWPAWPPRSPSRWQAAAGVRHARAPRPPAVASGSRRRAAVGDAPRPCAPGPASTGAELIAALGPGWPAELAGWSATSSRAGTSCSVDGLRAEVIEHDAHAPGHAACGCRTRGCCSPATCSATSSCRCPSTRTTCRAYLAGPRPLAPYVAAARVLVPGHGSPTERARSTRLDADRRYLDALLAGADADDPRRDSPAWCARRARDAVPSRAADRCTGDRTSAR